MQTLSICIPCTDVVKAEFSLCLANLTKRLSSDGIESWVHMQKGSLIASQRHRLAEEAMTMKSFGILWLDSDMTFPAGIYNKLIKHEKPIIGSPYSYKDNKKRSTATIDHNGILEYVDKGTGIRQVDSIGFGAIYTDIDVFHKLPRPWFQTTYDYEYDYHNGEDVFFCELAKEHDYEIWADMDLSKQVGHIGHTEYKL